MVGMLKEKTMSDGNYNRNLLPYNNYRSGFNAGSSQTRQKALNAFRKWCELRGEASGNLDIEESVSAFKSLLDS